MLSVATSNQMAVSKKKLSDNVVNSPGKASGPMRAYHFQSPLKRKETIATSWINSNSEHEQIRMVLGDQDPTTASATLSPKQTS